MEAAGAMSVSDVNRSLLKEALGEPLLSYLLGVPEAAIGAWLASGQSVFNSVQQAVTVRNLEAFVQSLPPIGQSDLSPLVNLPIFLSTYREDLGATLADTFRMQATGQPVDMVEGSSVDAHLAALAYDAYPCFLLPPEVHLGSPRPNTHGHPRHELFMKSVMAHGDLQRMFLGLDPIEPTGLLFRNTGGGGDMQIVGFASTLLETGWRAAASSSLTCPTRDEYVEAVLEQLDTVWHVIVNKNAAVSMRIGLMGVLLDSDEPINLGWGVLRKADARDAVFAQHAAQGTHASAGEDGELIEIAYSGDVVLETTFEYTFNIRKPGMEYSSDNWPKDDTLERVTNFRENVQLALLLAREFKASDPVAVVPAWRAIQDPLMLGPGVAWWNPRDGRTPTPARLSTEDGAKWGNFVKVIEDERQSSKIDVAIRRILRAASERRDHTDMLLDSMIALENLIGGQGETTLRVSGSLAWLLGNGVSGREELRAEVVKIYRLRSDLVHGNARKPPTPQEVARMAFRTLELAVGAMRVLLTSRVDVLRASSNPVERSNQLLMGG